MIDIDKPMLEIYKNEMARSAKEELNSRLIMSGLISDQRPIEIPEKSKWSQFKQDCGCRFYDFRERIAKLILPEYDFEEDYDY